MSSATRLTRLLRVLEWYPRENRGDVEALAAALGATPAAIRRDLRDLHAAGAFDSATQRAHVEAQRPRTDAERVAAATGARLVR